MGKYMNSDQIIRINKIKFDVDEKLKFSDQNDWFREILKELNEDFEIGEIENSGSQILFNGFVSKVNDSRYKDVVLLSGKLHARHLALCGVSGDIIEEEIEIDIMAAFLSLEIRDKYSLQEELNIFIQNETYDLFYYEQNRLDLKSVMHEYIFLNKNPYPQAN